MEESQEKNLLRKFKNHNIQQLFFKTLVLALYYYCGDNKNTDFFQNTCFKESNSMAVKQTNKLQSFMKKDIFQFLSYGIKKLSSKQVASITYTLEKGLCRCYFQRFVGSFFLDKVKNVWYILACLSLPSISIGKKTSL